MKIIFKLLPGIILAKLLVSGCALPSETMMTRLVKGSKAGMIVGTISLENRKRIASEHSFFYAHDSILIQKEQGTFLKTGYTQDNQGSIVMGQKGDFKENKKQVFFFSIVKLAGKYRFYGIQLFLNTGYMQSIWKMPIDIPFEIEEGKIKYLGEINLKVKDGELQILNEIERDRIKFKEKFPNIEF
jgi:hypothetical protein